MKRRIALFLAMVLLLGSACLDLTALASAGDAAAQASAYDQHRIGLTSVNNARDLGGYRTKDGKMVRFGKLLRTANLTDITDYDIRKLQGMYRLETVVDFRSDRNIITDGEDPEIPGVENIRCPFSSSQHMLADPETIGELPGYIRSIAELDRNGTLVHDLYTNNYGDVFTTEDGYAMIRGFFRALLDSDGGAVLWHCQSGKDRTGNAAMLLLSVLGVDRETIIEDFLLTNEYYAERQQQIYDIAYSITRNAKTAEDIALISGVHRDYLETSFRTIEENYGTVEAFLKEKIGLTEADFRTLRSKYLTEPGKDSPKRVMFRDVSVSQWYYRYVRDAWDAGLMTGVSKTEFRPEAKLTRGQFAAVLYTLSGAPSLDGYDCPFKDVPGNSWAQPYIAWAYGNGLTAGTSAEKYSPNAYITRQQMALMLYRSSRTPAAGAGANISDLREVGSAYRPAVVWAVSRKIMAGYKDGAFHPGSFVTRAQMATIALAYRDL